MFKALEADVALSFYPAAYWIAPYARTGTQYLYAYPEAMDQIECSLHLSSSLKEENVIVSVPRDLGILHDVYEPVPGIYYYCIRNYPDGIGALAEACRPMLEHLSGAKGYGFIERKFESVDSHGPDCVKNFVRESRIMGDRSADQWQQDAFGQVDAWLRAHGLRM